MRLVVAVPIGISGAGVVDESAGRYADGLPKVVDGQQVLRDGDAIAHAKAATSTEPFLLGGWLTPVRSRRRRPRDARPLWDRQLLATVQPSPGRQGRKHR